MNVAWAILWKDLLSEWRSRDRIVSMGIFSLLVVVIFHFALPSLGAQATRTAAPGLLWVAYLFAAVIGLNRSFAVELENDTLSALALAPADRGWVFAGKAAANWVLIGLVQAAVAGVFALLFDLDLASSVAPLALILALSTTGISAVGTLCSAMAVRTRLRDVLLPILLLPALFPVLSGAVRGTEAALSGEPLPFDAVQLLLVVDGVYLIVSFLGFDTILDE